MNSTKPFTFAARNLSRNPLGIIALFIVLVYGFACLLFSVSVDALSQEERQPIVYFIVLFPTLVLGIFGWLVSQHHDKLYSPNDYREDQSFLNTIRRQQAHAPELDNPTKVKVDDLLEYGKEYSTIDEYLVTINKELKNRGLETESDSVRVLARHLAGMQFKEWFERTYRLLFGSQIALLHSLNARKDGVHQEKVENYFNSRKSKFSPIFDEWDLSKYLDFLYENRLIKVENETISITGFGRDFLELLKALKYSESKAL